MPFANALILGTKVFDEINLGYLLFTIGIIPLPKLIKWLLFFGGNAYTYEC
jgi:hypothetical protein